MFRPHLPIIGPISMDYMYKDFPFLFWTIIIIVSSRLPDTPYAEVFKCLEEPYLAVLKNEIMEAPLPLYKIQALLYLCTWPLPVDKQTEDPSWLYCGIAIHAARFMGLDRNQPVPSLHSLGVVSGDAQARLKTWLGCFCVGTACVTLCSFPVYTD